MTDGGHRYSFGAPSKGWPTFGADGKIVREFTDLGSLPGGSPTAPEGGDDSPRDALTNGQGAGKATLAALDDVMRTVYGPVIRDNLLQMYRDPPLIPDGLNDADRARLRDFIRTAPLDEVVKLLPDPGA